MSFACDKWIFINDCANRRNLIYARHKVAIGNNAANSNTFANRYRSASENSEDETDDEMEGVSGCCCSQKKKPKSRLPGAQDQG